MLFKMLAKYQNELSEELELIAKQYQLHSLLIMESTPDTMIVFAANQQPNYRANDAGPKSTQPGCHELYCERVVNSKQALLVADASMDDEWKGNEDLVKFGLGVYYGLPIMHQGEAIGTLCALNDKPFNFEAGEPSAIARLTQLRHKIEQLLVQVPSTA